MRVIFKSLFPTALLYMISALKYFFLLPDTLSPVLISAGQEWRMFDIGISGGEGGRLDGVFLRYGGIPALV